VSNAKLKCTFCQKRKPRESMKRVPVGNFCNMDHLIEYANAKKKPKKKNKQKRETIPALLPKENAIRCKKYTDWVKTLPCCICGKPGQDPHHIIGYGHGGTGTKAPDDMTMSLCRKCHNRMHDEPELWFLQKGFIRKTKKKADIEGISYVRI